MIKHEPALRDLLARNIADHELLTVPDDEYRRAAVAVVIVNSQPDQAHVPPSDTAEQTLRQMANVPGDLQGFDGSMNNVSGGAAFLLCLRAATLRRHGGQFALPGGRVDPGESAEETARRELAEELGLHLEPQAVLGRLDDYVTRSGFVITPVVLWVDDDSALHPDPAEVASVHRIGLHQLQRADSPRFVTIPESDRPVVQLPIGRNLLHAPTGAVMLQFRRVAMEGDLGHRVCDLEQPVFAWK
jgi:8-oxo-dGTP pyrophosphatase MutT (NUDIX family)